MKTHKGKVHPSPSSSQNRDSALSVLNFLPAAILTLAALSVEDREVLAYLITRSGDEKRKCKKPVVHKPPMFDCGCFECYMSYWCRWDSSPNRKEIHEAILAFEEHLADGEKNKGRGVRGKRRNGPPPPALAPPPVEATPAPVFVLPEQPQRQLEIVPVTDAVMVNASDCEEEEPVDDNVEVPPPPPPAVQVSGGGSTTQRGIARKILPDVLGLFNSRLWNLWSPGN